MTKRWSQCSRWARLAPVAALAALGFLLAACGTSSSSSSKADDLPAKSVSSTPSSPMITVQQNSKYGTVLVDSSGKALYTYGADAGHGGQATCTGGCLQAWPPLTVPAGTAPTGGPGVTGTLAAVKQADGRYQVTYRGLPLYTYVQDTAAGQVNGNGVGGFSVATTTSGNTSSSASTSTTASGGYGGY